MAHDDGGARLHEAGSGGDDNEAGDDAGTEAEGGRLAGVDPLCDHPGEAGGGRGDGGGGEGQAGEAACRIGAVGADDGGAGVEAEPAEPEEADAEQGERQAVGCHALLREAVTLAEEEEDRQGRDTGGEVNDGAAGEVEGAHLEEPAVASSRPSGPADRRPAWSRAGRRGSRRRT